MSAKLETFLEIKKVVDHDCGNYRMGEIDFYPRNDVKEYIRSYGKNGYRDLQDCFHDLLETARVELHVIQLEESGKFTGSAF